MARRSYPWSVLDIAPTDDERAIKIAYAKKLKVTRPEDNPEGFQRLVEARDRAIFLKLKPRKKKPRKASDGSLVEPPAEALAPITVVNPAIPPPVAALAQPGDTAVWEAPQQDVVTSEPPGTSTEDGPERFSAVIAGFLTGTVSVVTQADADAAVQAISQLDITGRAHIEHLLLDSVRDYLENVAPVVDVTTYDAGNRRVQQRDIIMSLDEEFGWTASDRRVEEILGWGSEDFVDALHKYKNPKYRPSTADIQKRAFGWRRLIHYVVLGFFALKLIGACSHHYSP